MARAPEEISRIPSSNSSKSSSISSDVVIALLTSINRLRLSRSLSAPVVKSYWNCVIVISRRESLPENSMGCSSSAPSTSSSPSVSSWALTRVPLTKRPLVLRSSTA